LARSYPWTFTVLDLHVLELHGEGGELHLLLELHEEPLGENGGLHGLELLGEGGELHLLELLVEDVGIHLLELHREGGDLLVL